MTNNTKITPTFRSKSKTNQIRNKNTQTLKSHTHKLKVTILLIIITLYEPTQATTLDNYSPTHTFQVEANFLYQKIGQAYINQDVYHTARRFSPNEILKTMQMEELAITALSAHCKRFREALDLEQEEPTFRSYPKSKKMNWLENKSFCENQDKKLPEIRTKMDFNELHRFFIKTSISHVAAGIHDSSAPPHEMLYNSDNKLARLDSIFTHPCVGHSWTRHRDDYHNYFWSYMERPNSIIEVCRSLKPPDKVYPVCQTVDLNSTIIRMRTDLAMCQDKVQEAIGTHRHQQELLLMLLPEEALKKDSKWMPQGGYPLLTTLQGALEAVNITENISRPKRSSRRRTRMRPGMRPIRVRLPKFRPKYKPKSQKTRSHKPEETDYNSLKPTEAEYASYIAANPSATTEYNSLKPTVAEYASYIAANPSQVIRTHYITEAPPTEKPPTRVKLTNSVWNYFIHEPISRLFSTNPDERTNQIGIYRKEAKARHASHQRRQYFDKVMNLYPPYNALNRFSSEKAMSTNRHGYTRNTREKRSVYAFMAQLGINAIKQLVSGGQVRKQLLTIKQMNLTMNQRFEKLNLNAQQLHEEQRQQAHTVNQAIKKQSKEITALQNNHEIIQLFMSLDSIRGTINHSILSLYFTLQQILTHKVPITLLTPREIDNLNKELSTKMNIELTNDISQITAELTYDSETYWAIFNIPVIDEIKKMSIYRIHPLPIFHTNHMFTPKIENEYFAAATKNNRYTMMNAAEAALCHTQIHCQLPTPTQHHTNNKCGISEFYGKKSACPLIKTEKKDLFLTFGNETFFAVSTPQTIRGQCEIKKPTAGFQYAIEISGRGTLISAPTCQLTSNDNSIILPKSRYFAGNIDEQNESQLQLQQLDTQHSLIKRYLPDNVKQITDVRTKQKQLQEAKEHHKRNSLTSIAGIGFSSLLLLMILFLIIYLYKNRKVIQDLIQKYNLFSPPTKPPPGSEQINSPPILRRTIIQPQPQYPSKVQNTQRQQERIEAEAMFANLPSTASHSSAWLSPTTTHSEGIYFPTPRQQLGRKAKNKTGQEQTENINESEEEDLQDLINYQTAQSPKLTHHSQRLESIRKDPKLKLKMATTTTQIQVNTEPIRPDPNKPPNRPAPTRRQTAQ
jgi:hypothetical protein